MKSCLAVVGGIVALIVLAILALGGYGFVKTRQLGKESQAAFVQLRETNTEFPFAPPADGKLVEPRLDELFEVRVASVASVRVWLQTVEKLQTNQSERPSFGDVFKAATGVKDLLVTAPADLGRNLRGKKMSVDEYVWELKTVLGTLVAAADQGDAQAKEVIASMKGRVENLSRGHENPGDALPQILEELKGTPLDPDNLRLAVARKEALAADSAVVVFDSFVCNKEFTSSLHGETGDD